jgi:hypothetical protein
MSGQRIFTDLPAVNIGATSVIKLPIGRTYHGIYLNFSACTLAEITDIRFVANGEVIHRFDTGTDLDNLNKQNGLATAGSGDFTLPLVIHLDRKGMRGRDGEEFTALGTGIADDPLSVTNLQIEVDINPSATGATFTAQAEQSGPQPSGLILKTRLFSYAPSASGTFEISDLPKGDLISRVWFNHANVTGLEVQRDNLTIHKRTVALNNYKLALDGYHAAPAAGYMLDFGEAGFAAGALATKGVQDLRFKLTMSGAATVPVYVEYIGSVNR